MESHVQQYGGGYKKAQDDLQEMCLENLDLSKEYAHLVEDKYSFLNVSFDNALRQVNFFHPEVQRLRK